MALQFSIIFPKYILEFSFTQVTSLTMIFVCSLRKINLCAFAWLELICRIKMLRHLGLLKTTFFWKTLALSVWFVKKFAWTAILAEARNQFKDFNFFVVF